MSQLVLKVLVKLRVSAALQPVDEALDTVSLFSPCRYIYHEYCRPNEDPHSWRQAVRFDHWKAVRYASVSNIGSIGNRVGRYLRILVISQY